MVAVAAEMAKVVIIPVIEVALVVAPVSREGVVPGQVLWGRVE
jgi:hypothetical protein